MKTSRDCILIMLCYCAESCTRDKRVCISPGTVCETMAEITLDMILRGEY